MAQTPEGKVKNEIKKVLTKRGVWFFMPVAGPFGRHGIPDFICCYKGNFLAIEAKAPKGQPTELQLETLSQISSADGWTVIAYDGETVDSVLTAIDVNLRLNP